MRNNEVMTNEILKKGLGLSQNAEHYEALAACEQNKSAWSFVKNSFTFRRKVETEKQPSRSRTQALCATLPNKMSGANVYVLLHLLGVAKLLLG
jgi:hypothetical protein